MMLTKWKTFNGAILSVVRSWPKSLSLYLVFSRATAIILQQWSESVSDPDKKVPRDDPALQEAEPMQDHVRMKPAVI